MSERRWDFFIMHLAATLGMTRRQLLANIDSHELSTWIAYLKEMNTPQEQSKKENREQVANQLKNMFMVKTKGKKNAVVNA